MKSEKAERDFDEKKIVVRCIKIAAIILGIAVLIRIILFPPYKQPAVTGNYAVAIEEYTWEDESRVETFTDTGENRALTVKFWYPEEEGRYPLVVFSHGAFGVIDSNYSTCMELASNGYVVASIAHPYHAMFVKDVNGKVTTVDMDFFKSVYEGNGTRDPEEEEKNYLKYKEWMALRTADENFVLDTILSKAEKGENGPFRVIDSEKIGLFGHSMGGASSVALGRERDDIDAVIDLEGTMLGEYVGFENGIELFNQEPYPVPVLDVNSV
ncbi:MAG: dienelactone hydrolase family protein, partial [Lachnospiraceae bacterium]|nr:dienelactone hydrolase family protein [Lachnospiraceae bacterium]